MFFAAPAPPSPAQTEAFVAKVLGRIEEEAPASPLWAWLSARWAVPALGMSIAVFLAAILWPGARVASSLESWSTGEAQQARFAADLGPEDG